MEKKQSSVEWLYERLERMIPRSPLYNGDKIRYLEQAKAMHKKEYIDAWMNGQNDSGYSQKELRQMAEEDYNETYETAPQPRT